MVYNVSFEHQLNFDWRNTLCTTQRKFSFLLVSFICRFLKPEISLNFSNFDRQDFVKSQNFDRYDVIMT